MTKNFFVVVPYTPALVNVENGVLSNFPWKKKKVDSEAANRTFEENASQLEQRVSIVQQGLIRSGVRTVQLGTDEIVELLYKIFNPGEQDKPIHILSEQQ
jgi:hypothetical protein